MTLITGASGLLGGRLASLLASGGLGVVAARHRAAPPGALPSVPLDLTDAGSLAAILDRARPQAVLHCAAQADPDRCEREPALAQVLNVDASARLARLCHRRGLRLVALSTDLVFPGDRPNWRETDDPHPLLVYAQSKLGGERAVLVEAPGAAVARIALVYGRGFGPRGTASETIAWRLRAAQPVRLFTDQYRTPVDPESVAQALAVLLRGDASGVFHLGGPERVSRYQLGLRVAELLGLPAEQIEAVTQAGEATAP
ncbi:MAG TPA: SDR family oxidoreductase, partial [Vicinamibacteria bacterium]|nr:SDR family oxidoreductase [Vicinamibacteria bacterium]